MNPAVLQRTQDTLGKVIRKPPLTERLLSKPPFRYLHDVIGEVIRTTDFMKGLYTESELKSDNVKDKEAKISFLQKAVDVVTIVLGEPLSVKPARVVAGHEPEKTNELLQAIGKCCLSKLSSEDAVRKVLAGERPDLKGKPSSSKSQDKENRGESKEDERKSQKDREERKASEIRDRSASRERKAREPVKEEDKRRTEKERDRERSREKDTIREEEKPDPEKKRVKAAKPEKERTREKDREKGHEKDRRSETGKGKERDRDRTKEREKDKGRERDKELERDKDLEKRRDRTKESERKFRGTEESIHKKTSDASAGDAKSDADKELSSPPKTIKHSAGRGTRRQTKLPTDGESGSEAEDTEKPPAVVNGETSEDLPPQALQRRIPRPNSARPAPPRVKRQGSADMPPPERVSSGKIVSSVIVEKPKEDEDEDEQFVVEEAEPLPPEMPEMETDAAVELDGNEKHGGLVKRILETKKDYDAQQPLAKTTEKISLSEAGRKKEKDLVSKEIEKLRTSIQTVCRSALPLGKIMDYIQEDMDAMQNELQTWRSENKVHAEALLREQSITDSAVEPLRIELADLEQLIKEQQDKICTVKANILRNEEKIQKMVFSISASSRT